MRFRGKSIRRKIVALLLVPLVSLTAIWAFATVLTGREASRLFSVSDIVEKIGYPTEDTVRVLQQERRQTLVYLADPRASDGHTALERSRSATDRVLAKVRRNAKDKGVRKELGGGTSERLTSLLDAVEGIPSLRSGIEDGTVNRAQALGLYNRLIDPCYVLLANLHVVDDVELDKQSRALVNVSRARELLSREDALLGSALVDGHLTRDELREISDLVAQRTLLYDVSLPLLPSAERDRFERYWRNAGTAPLRVAEQAVADSTAGSPSGVTARSWDGAAGHVLAELGELEDQAGDHYQDRVRPVAMGVILKAVVAGVVGLIALLISLFMSVRIGRSLIRDLRRLRLEAHEASGVRLPSVMRRLSAGEQVDVETEVPRLEYDRNEIGEVGQALNTLQRAAVEAAVKQSELREGVSEVFVNLARRSQVLLHKQLTLLDTMERRTEDTDELADLFRLDHLTTRMRRHAEGLVILSGAAPSRQWRKPVQLMDIVRAAVAEVEDYERVEVRRLPRIAVTGPAVADVTHLVAELLENATVFSPPHTAVHVVGERVANGFTLEIHDRGLGMAAEALLDANLRLAETPEFELSDTDRLGLFVVSRLAQRQNVRVSLQPSPYGGTTAVVFMPDSLLTDDVPDTNGIGFRLDRTLPTKDAETEASRKTALTQSPVRLPGLPASVLDGPVELESPVDLDTLTGFPGALGDDDSERGGLFRPRRSIAGVPAGRHQLAGADDSAHPGDDDRAGTAPVALPRRRTPKLVSSHGRPVTQSRSWRDRTDDDADRDLGSTQDLGAPSAPGPRERADLPERGATELDGPKPLPKRRGERSAAAARHGAGRSGDPGPREAFGAPDRPGLREAPDPRRSPGLREATGHPDAPALPRRSRGSASAAGPNDTTSRHDTAVGQTEPGTTPLPRRVRQASLAPRLKDGPARLADRDKARDGTGPDPADRDADEVRSRMASLQRGWQRGREENAVGDQAQDGSARRTTEGDGR
ncbi:nitrate- and nitrite sensing domain-containing protein [Streptomyces sp. NBC_00358]|jgi:HAMP domain./Histidine kinase-, DNA gyrase B-, and HSP90-like ATPase./Nitrate and nitrite sensing.|uniref:nitrate- and nitrite sensing domain-containing protein n=1 Tax=Streptomyces sp. NBC_00358 TaxID=2975725 RepID=UPI002E25B6FE